MKKILFISGSARNGNCKQILEELQSKFWLEYSTEVIHIRDFELVPCMGCNLCSKSESHKCVKEDKIDLLLTKVFDAEIVVLATPNYFYNMSSLTKLFVDKTYPCYQTRALKNKKFIYIYIGNDSESNIKKFLDNAMYGFTACHGVNLLGSYAYSAGNVGEFLNPKNKENTNLEIEQKIRENL